MIVTEKDSWLRMIFAVHGTTFDKIWPRFLVVVSFSIVTTLISYYFPDHKFTLTMAPFTVVGLAIAIFLGFRNNASYDRYWEGRKLWGRMVNVCRSFTMQVNTLVDGTNPDANATDESVTVAQRRRMIELTIAYINAVRHRLRDTDATDELMLRLHDDPKLQSYLAQDNIPAAVAAEISNCIQAAWKSGTLNTYHVPILHTSLTEMLAIQGGCERIRSTPIPFTYSVLTHRTVLLYCLALPCGLHDTVGLLTPVVVGLVAYAFLGLDAVGDEIEQPFSVDDNDLPLLFLTTMIERNMRQMSGYPAEELPAPVEPVDHLLI
ncbi:bestrophin family protein [Bremerella cremea]|uniref:bestrophin family protein n=1 Tax=Bremerella cremea TaxID=1031537 RepID=UPI0031ED45F4